MTDAKAPKNGNCHGEKSEPAPAPPSLNPPAPAALTPVAEKPIIKRDAAGRVLPGFANLNPKGKPPGTPNRNTELHRICTTNEFREVWKMAKDQAKKGKNELLEFLLERVLVKLTPEAAAQAIGLTVHNNHSEQNVTPLLIGDPVARDLVARLEEHVAGRLDAGGNGSARQ